jgi:histone acetyltransferase (RNA polymerase elongator complex component)
MKKLTVPFFISHRGCPHRCVFCDQVKISGSGEELPEEFEIRKKIAEYRNTGKREFTEVAFFGGSFTALPLKVQERMLVPLQPLIAAGDVDGVKVSTRPDCVDGATAIFLKKMGVSTVELGAQSMDDDVLELSGRGHGSRETEDAVSCLKEGGLTVGIQLMPGLPGDTPAKSLASLSRVLSLKPDFLRIYPTVVIAGTQLEEAYRQGSYLPMTLDQAVRLSKVMLLESMRLDVPVIRMGLQPTDELRRTGVVVAGPYHPAFRQMVEAELCLDLLSQMISDAHPIAEPVTVFCSPSRISDVIGQKKSNTRLLKRRFGVNFAGVMPDPEMSPVELRVESGSRKNTGNMLQDLRYGPEVCVNA